MADTTQRRTHITVVGSINMDLVATCERLPRPGETVAGTGFTTTPGGKGSNQAIAAARAGAAGTQVTMIGAVGSDVFGAELVATLDSAGVRTARVRRLEGQSGIAQITVDGSAENSIVVVPGANGSVLTFDNGDRAAITGADMLMTQLEIPIPGVLAAAGIATQAGVPVLLNPSPVRELPEELLRAVTVLVVNEGEAAALGTALDRVPHVVTTLGAAGARYRGPDGEQVTVAAPRVAAVDTTGAGDAFTGALAVAWAQSETPEAALRRACAAGALATTVHGAAASSPQQDAIDALVGESYR